MNETSRCIHMVAIFEGKRISLSFIIIEKNSLLIWKNIDSKDYWIRILKRENIFIILKCLSLTSNSNIFSKSKMVMSIEIY
jgi:hypothetical protein